MNYFNNCFEIFVEKLIERLIEKLIERLNSVSPICFCDAAEH